MTDTNRPFISTGDSMPAEPLVPEKNPADKPPIKDPADPVNPKKEGE